MFNQNYYFKRKKSNFIFFLLFIKLIFIIVLIIIIFIKIYKKNDFKSYINGLLKNNVKIRFAIYIYCISNGGRERITTLLLNYLSKESIFDLYLFVQKTKSIEYKISEKIKRIHIPQKKGTLNVLKDKIIKNKIDIFVYQSYNIREMKMLNKLKNTKTIFFNHSCFLFWIYFNRISYIKNIYNMYKNSKYIISLIPFENDFLFKKWGINSILMSHLNTFKNYNISPSNLTSPIILMIGRGYDKLKRFYLGIEAMKYIVKEIPNCEMKIISVFYGINHLIKLVEKLNLKNNVKFVGFTTNPEIYYKNASLHIFTSICESFSMVLLETKIYGIPSIATGIDYTVTSKEGVINIFDDNPESIAKEAIKLLKNKTYREKIGKIAKESTMHFKNQDIIKKWIKLIIAVYKGNKYYKRLAKENKKISKKEAIILLKNQIKLLKMRYPKIKNLDIKDFFSFKFTEKLLKIKIKN